jgi:hypothetical protein
VVLAFVFGQSGMVTATPVAAQGIARPVPVQGTAEAVPVPARSTPTETRVTPTYAIRGVYGNDASSTGFSRIQTTGFDVVNTGAYPSDLATLQSSGMKGLVWLGGYSNDTCQFYEDDSWVRSHVRAIAGSAAIAAYYVADEPNSVSCPTAPSQIKARSHLVKRLDPTKPSFIVISENDGQTEYPYAKFAGKADIMGVDIYPCNHVDPACTFQDIPAAVAALTKAGVSDYWGILQAFGDHYYRMPTATEIGRQFDLWSQSSMTGYLYYTWSDEPVSIAGHRDVIAELKLLNGR